VGLADPSGSESSAVVPREPLKQYGTTIPDGLYRKLKTKAIGTTLQVLVEVALRRGLEESIDTLLLLQRERAKARGDVGKPRPFSVKVRPGLLRTLRIEAAAHDVSDTELVSAILWDYAESDQVPPGKRDLPSEYAEAWTAIIIGRSRVDPVTGKVDTELVRNEVTTAFLRAMAERNPVEGIDLSKPKKAEPPGRSSRAKPTKQRRIKGAKPGATAT
jgi:hypothetical protein